uniref:Uncharacterized protein n=1 Tax=Triticum urartu TaxID=4572 RepID=A0A8R7V6E1_TRIUA
MQNKNYNLLQFRCFEFFNLELFNDDSYLAPYYKIMDRQLGDCQSVLARCVVVFLLLR